MDSNPDDQLAESGARKEHLLFMLAALIVVVIYANTLTGPFVFDDRPHIVENPYIRLAGLSFDDLKEVIQKSRYRNRPVANMSLALNYYANGYNVVGYHAVNILIHICSGFFLYLLLKVTLNLPSLRERFSYHKWIPLLSALLWLVHPIQTQSVSYIIQRMNSMAAMFYILSLLLYVRFRLAPRKGKKGLLLSGCVLAGLLSLGTKEIAVTLPFFIFLYEWFFFQNLSGQWLNRRAPVLAALGAFAMLLAFIYLGSNPLDGIKMGYSAREFTPGLRLLTELRVVVFYVSLLLWPHPQRLNLTHDFSLSLSFFQPPGTFFSLLLIVGFLLAAICLAKRHPLFSFCVLWFFGNLVIESSVIALELVFEHRLYLPSMMALFLVVVGLFGVIRPQWLAITLLCVAVATSSIWTYQRNAVWADDVALWRDCAQKSPAIARAYTNLASALVRRGNLKEAAAHYQAALKLKPEYAEPHFNLGIIQAKSGQLAEGLKHFRKAIEIEPHNFKAQNNLGAALLSGGRLDEAISHLQTALEINPDYPEAHNNLGQALQLQGNRGAALDHFKEALHLDPAYARAHVNLGIVLRQMGRLQEAGQHFEEALRLRPGYAPARINLDQIRREHSSSRK
ncbi:MAG: tetratricopeptide repeat protein [Desulfobacterales bacterium]|jgi:tetratricopeptide (TPR) repeat protein